METQTQSSLIRRYFSVEGHNPYDLVDWSLREAEIKDHNTGEIIFRQEGMEFPEVWSDTAVKVVAQKYFKGKLGTPDRESSVRQLVGRVVNTIAEWGLKDEYFATQEEADIFRNELATLILGQYGTFNSPVWFNVGVPNTNGHWAWNPAKKKAVPTRDDEHRPQVSACQPYDALINTELGFMKIGDIVTQNRVGLRVYSEQGLAAVQAVKANGRKPVFRVKLNNGFYVDATADHVVCAHQRRRTATKEWKRVDELKKGMYMRIYPSAMDLLTSSNSTETSEAALAGWIQADGFSGKYAEGTNNSQTLEFITMNDDEFNWVQQHLRVVFPDVHQKVTEVETEDKSLSGKRIRLYGKPLEAFVVKYGLNNRQLSIRVPNTIWTASTDAIKAYLRSVFQADGYIALRKKTSTAMLAAATISKDWMHDIQILLTRLGILSRVSKKDEKREDRHDLYEVQIMPLSERKKFHERIGFIAANKAVRLEQSLNLKGKRALDVRYAEITSIEPLGEMDVYDIQTSTGTYLTNSVLVHNCFILSVKDDMDSILNWYTEEGRIFSNGSGAGINLSSLRGSMEYLSGGGKASGPVTFMKPADANAGTIKSGGKTRRAAKMVILNCDHPDIEDFIACKAKAEKIARDLMSLGYDGSFNSADGAYAIISFQNANNSVRVTDEFMRAVQKDGDFWTKLVHTGERHKKYKARDLFRKMAEAAHYCGDPGTQFHDTVNEWNVCADTEEIVASNPCSEFMFLVDTACNLASLNLMKFRRPNGSFAIEDFRRAVHVFTVAQDIVVDNGGYPTEKMALRSHQYRPLGLGFANLGALLMSLGIAYDSDAGRNIAAEITALMTGQAYLTSAQLAGQLGPFAMWEKNRKSALKVLLKHDHAAQSLPHTDVGNAAREVWSQTIELAEKNGERNAQTTVLAPTGTIAFMMDCATTGIEPDLGLVKYKTLVGGGTLKMVNPITRQALETIGFTDGIADRILKHIEETGSVEGAEGVSKDLYPIFDTSLPAGPSQRSIHYMGHVKMMAAVQPFLSGAISKTVNMPNSATVEEIMEVYQSAWELGLKSIAIYRDGCKGSQPLSTTASGQKIETALPGAHQRKLNGDRTGVIHEFRLNGHKGYLTVGLYDDGTPAEIFLDISKEGSTISGLMDTIAILTSFCLQYGVPLEKLVDKFKFMSFEPSGWTGIDGIGFAKSLPDYIFRWLGLKFLQQAPQTTVEMPAALPAPASDAPMCSECGTQMQRSGSCHRCPTCGSTSGCS